MLLDSVIIPLDGISCLHNCQRRHHAMRTSCVLRAERLTRPNRRPVGSDRLGGLVVAVMVVVVVAVTAVR